MKSALLLAGTLVLVGCTTPIIDYGPAHTPTPVVQVIPSPRPPATPTVLREFPPTVTPTTGVVPPNRDDPKLMVQTYFDLLQRGDRDTASSFWRDPRAKEADVKKVNAMFPPGSMQSYEIGQVQPNGAAGTIYYAVPVAMTTTPSSGPVVRYAVCLTLSRSNVPTGNTNPPYPIVIRSAQVNQTGADGDTVMRLATAMAQAGDCGVA